MNNFICSLGVMLQLSLPIYALINTELPQKFSWQMFSRGFNKYQIKLIKQNNTEVLIDYRSHFLNIRSDIDFAPYLKTYLCKKYRNSKTMIIEESDGYIRKTYPCPV
jgi:hypothetical protein